MLSRSGIVEAILISDGVLVLATNTTNCVDAKEVAELNLFELGEVVTKLLESLLWTPTVESLVVPLQRTLTAGCFRLCRLSVVSVLG